MATSPFTDSSKKKLPPRHIIASVCALPPRFSHPHPAKTAIMRTPSPQAA